MWCIPASSVGRAPSHLARPQPRSAARLALAASVAFPEPIPTQQSCSRGGGGGKDQPTIGKRSTRSGSARHQQFRARSKTRVDDMLSGLQSARSTDASVLEAQLHQMLGECRAEHSVPSSASSLQGNNLELSDPSSETLCLLEREDANLAEIGKLNGLLEASEKDHSEIVAQLKSAIEESKAINEELQKQYASLEENLKKVEAEKMDALRS